MLAEEDNENGGDLDISWLEEHEKLNQIDHNYFREPLDSIDIYSVYVNTDMAIEHIEIERLDVGPPDVGPPDVGVAHDEVVLSQEKLLYLIQKKKIRTNPVNGVTIKYSLKDILLYVIELDPVHIQHFAQSEIAECAQLSKPFLKPCKMLDHIILPPSVFIFHSLNGLYLIMQERERDQPKPMIVTSILKKTRKIIDDGTGDDAAGGGGVGGGGGGCKNHTKKVTIRELGDEAVIVTKIIPKKMKTRKRKPVSPAAEGGTIEAAGAAGAGDAASLVEADSTSTYAAPSK
jgi:hypothetical protein